MARRIWWEDASGVLHQLSDLPEFQVMYGRAGMHMPPISYVEDIYPFEAGGRLRAVKTDIRSFEIPVAIMGTTGTELAQRLETLVGWMDPELGDGKIRVEQRDGSLREIVCRYQDGLQMEHSVDNSGLLWQTVVISFRAWQPHWQDVTDTVVTATIGTGSGQAFLGNPFLGLNLGYSQLFASLDINNTGRDPAETWPKFTVTGPGKEIAIRNITTGKVIQITHTLGPGDTIEIDTAPGVKTIHKPDGNYNIWYLATGATELWKLIRGTNRVQFEMADATSVSSIAIRYRARYRSM